MSYLPTDTYRFRRIDAPVKTGVFSNFLRFALAAFLLAGGSAASAQGNYTLSNNGPLKIPSNEYAPVTVTVTPGSLGFSGSVVLACTNMPVDSSCKFPGLNQILGVNNAATSITFLINTSLVDDYESKAVPQHSTAGRIAICSLFAPALGLLFFARRKGARQLGAARLMLFVLALVPLSALAGCAAVHPAGTPPGAYSVIITGSAGSQVQSTTIALTVT
jgi:hypothetical protein